MNSTSETYLPTVCVNCGNKHRGQCATNVTEFIWPYGGKSVYLTGSFNQWQAQIGMTPIQQKPNIFQCQMCLSAGTYQYQFLVDGEWMHDQNQRIQDDKFGGFNNQIHIDPKILDDQCIGSDEDEQEDEDEKIDSFVEEKKENRQNQKEHQESQISTYKPYGDSRACLKCEIQTLLDGSNMSVIGSWDNWKDEYQLTRMYNYMSNSWENVLEIYLLPGKYFYQFKIGVNWLHDPQKRNQINRYGTRNNILIAKIQKRTSSYLNLNHPISDPEKRLKTVYDLKSAKWESNDLEFFNMKNLEGHSVTAIGSKLYIFGGKDKHEIVDSFMSIDLDNKLECDHIKYTGTAPEKRAFHVAITFGVKILIYGGFNNDQVHSDYYVFNTVDNSWMVTNLVGQNPTPRERFSLNMYKNEALILFGGYFESKDSVVQEFHNDLYTMNVTTMVWKQLNPIGQLPKGRYAHTGVIIKRYLYIFGGKIKTQTTTTTNTNDVWRIALENETNILKWEQILLQEDDVRPKPRHGHIMLPMGFYFIIFGGSSIEKKKYYNDLLAFNTKTKKWIEIETEDPPRERCFHAGFILEDGEGQFGILGGVVEKMARVRKLHILKFNKLDQMQVSKMKKKSDDDQISSCTDNESRKLNFSGQQEQKKDQGNELEKIKIEKENILINNQESNKTSSFN